MNTTPQPAKTYTHDQFRRWGAQGGAKSKRKLTPEQARAMVAARIAKYRKKPAQ